MEASKASGSLFKSSSKASLEASSKPSGSLFKSRWKPLQNPLEASSKPSGSFFKSLWKPLQKPLGSIFKSLWEASSKLIKGLSGSFFKTLWKPLQKPLEASSKPFGSFFKTLWKLLQKPLEASSKASGKHLQKPLGSLFKSSSKASLEASSKPSGSLFKSRWKPLQNPLEASSKPSGSFFKTLWKLLQNPLEASSKASGSVWKTQTRRFDPGSLQSRPLEKNRTGFHETRLASSRPLRSASVQYDQTFASSVQLPIKSNSKLLQSNGGKGRRVKPDSAPPVPLCFRVPDRGVWGEKLEASWTAPGRGRPSWAGHGRSRRLCPWPGAGEAQSLDASGLASAVTCLEDIGEVEFIHTS